MPLDDERLAQRLAATRIRGSSDAKGSWNIICRSRRALRSVAPRSLKISLPAERDRAAVGLLDPDDHLAERRLAAAGLADEPERLARADREA